MKSFAIFPSLHRLIREATIEATREKEAAVKRVQHHRHVVKDEEARLHAAGMAREWLLSQKASVCLLCVPSTQRAV